MVSRFVEVSWPVRGGFEWLALRLGQRGLECLGVAGFLRQDGAWVARTGHGQPASLSSEAFVSVLRNRSSIPLKPKPLPPNPGVTRGQHYNSPFSGACRVPGCLLGG